MINNKNNIIYMLKKDRLILETLSKRYGKNTLLNEVSYELSKRALNKAKESHRWEQARTFAEYENVIKNRLIKDINNLKFEEIYSNREENINDDYLVLYISDGNLPMVLLNYCYTDGPTINNHLSVCFSEKNEELLFEINEESEIFNLILARFNKETKNNIILEDIFEGDVMYINDILLAHSTNDKKEARILANAAKKINKTLDTDFLCEDWHEYYYYGNSNDFGFDDKGKNIRESLSKRYGKEDMLNELNHKTISNAFGKAKKQGRWAQAKIFGDELYGKLNKVIDNLTFVPAFRGVNSADEVIKIFTNEDKNYPMAFLHYDTPGVESLFVITSSKYENDIDEKFLREVLNKFNKVTSNNIQYNDDESYLCHVPTDDIEEMIGIYLFEDKKLAREYAKTMSLLNNLFNVNMSTDWHDYFEKGYPMDYGFTSGGKYIRESLKESRQPSINSQNNRDIKVVVMPIEVLPFFDERLDNLSDDEILEYALNLRHAKIYSAADFNHLWNSGQLDYTSRNSYMRIIRQTK